MSRIWAALKRYLRTFALSFLAASSAGLSVFSDEASRNRFLDLHEALHAAKVAFLVAFAHSVLHAIEHASESSSPPPKE